MPQHVSDAFDPDTQSLALFQLAGNEKVFGHTFDEMPGVVTMLNGLQSSFLPDLVELSHQRLQLAAAVGCKDTNVDTLLVQSFQQDFCCTRLHFCGVLNLNKINNYYIWCARLRIMIQSFYVGFWSSSVCEKNPHRYKWLNMFDLWYLRLIIPSQRHCFFNIQINIFFTKSKIRISNDRIFKKKVDFKYTEQYLQ
jgi:hypothetical protein